MVLNLLEISAMTLLLHFKMAAMKKVYGVTVWGLNPSADTGQAGKVKTGIFIKHTAQNGAMWLPGDK